MKTKSLKNLRLNKSTVVLLNNKNSIKVKGGVNNGDGDTTELSIIINVCGAISVIQHCIPE